jgi:hypothetical protein
MCDVQVYELFIRYNDYKRQHGLYDEADLVFNIFQRLRLAGPLPWILHEVGGSVMYLWAPLPVGPTPCRSQSRKVCFWTLWDWDLQGIGPCGHRTHRDCKFTWVMATPKNPNP